MTRIAVLSDSHWDINSRWEETLRIHDWFVGDIKKREVDLVLHAGDFGPLVPIRQFKPVERLAVSGFLRAVTDYCPFYGVRGNHDLYLDLAIFNQLETKRPLRITEAPEVYTLIARDGQPVAIAGMPWPIKAEILARMPDASQEQVGEAAAMALRTIFLGLGTRLRELHMPSVMVMHAMVRASRVSTGQPIAPGQDFEIGQEDVGSVGADFSALGHVHLGEGNEWSWNRKTIAYVGSPRRTNFGEREIKSYTLLDFSGQPDPHGGWACKWQRVPIPCAPMLAFDCVWNPDHKHGFTYEGSTFFPDCAAEQGAEFRLRYRVPSDHREAAKLAAKAVEKELLEHGCVSVQIEEEVIPVTHARAPEIVQVLDIKDQLPVLWKTRSDIPTPERQERLFTKLAQLQTEVSLEA